MSSKKHWSHFIYALLYPIVFEENPMGEVERVLKITVEAGVLEASPQEYLIALRKALESEEKLSEKFGFLLRGCHSEELVRQYLVEVERRLQEIECKGKIL